MTRTDYWRECIAIAAEECGLFITKEQLTYLAEAVQGGDENIGMAFHQPENPMIGEIADLKRKLRTEQSKVVCETCKGRGRLIEYFGSYQSDSQCWKCHGEGKVIP